MQDQINETLKDEVFEEVRDTIQKHVNRDVYDAYSPTQYNRRGSSGGLIDENNIVGEIISDGMLFTKNIAEANTPFKGHSYSTDDDTMFGRWINDGLVYNFNGSTDPWTEARPFIDNAREELAKNEGHYKALKRGLKKRKVL